MVDPSSPKGLSTAAALKEPSSDPLPLVVPPQGIDGSQPEPSHSEEPRPSSDTAEEVNREEGGSLMELTRESDHEENPDSSDSHRMITPSTASPTHDLDSIIETFLDEEKNAYQFVKSQAPGLILSESNPLLYLQRYPGNPDAAARVLVAYWAQRYEVFGEDHFYLPLDMTGEGALTSEDIKVLEKGIVTALPPDSQGRVVMYLDLSLLEEDSLPESSLARIYWYMIQVVAEQDKAKEQGVVVLCLMSDSLDSVERVKLPLQLVHQILPSSPKVLHVVIGSDAPQGEAETCVATENMKNVIKSDVLKVFESSDCNALDDCLVVHSLKLTGNEAERTPPDSLLQAGFVPNSLPTRMGGTWSDSDFEFWRMTRVALERAKKANAKVRNPSSTNKRSTEQDSEEASGKKRRKFSSAPPESSPKRVKKSHLTKLTKTKGFQTPRSLTSKSYDTGPCRRSEIEQAVESLGISEDSKQAYLEAKKQIPELIYKETDPMSFLRITEGRVEEAAAKLVAHWSKRHDLFGPRTYMPLTQTGEGALNRADLTALSSGVLLILPNDSQGRSVVFFDCSKLGDSHRDSLRRIAFYMFSVASEVSTASNHGLVVVMALDNVNEGVIAKCNLVDILNVIPSPIEAVHVICFPFLSQEPGTPKPQLEQLARAAFGAMPDSLLLVHMDHTRSEALEKLYAHDLTASSLPKSMGGSWGVERFVEWCELRTRYEWDLPPAASHKGIDKIFDFSQMKPPSHLDEADKIERARRMNVLHSRRKRERERIEIEVLHEQVDELRARNKELAVEAVRLSGYMKSVEAHLMNPREEVQMSQAMQMNQALPMNQAAPMPNPQFHPQAADGTGTATDPIMISADSSAGFMPMPIPQPSMPPQMYQAYNPTFAPQGFAPPGQVYVTAAAPGPQYCIMPSGYFQPQMQTTGYQIQQVPMVPQQQQHYVPVMDYNQHYPHPQGGTMLVQVPMAPPAPGFAPPQGVTYSMPVPMMTTSSDAYGPYYTSVNANNNNISTSPPAPPETGYFAGDSGSIVDE